MEHLKTALWGSCLLFVGLSGPPISAQHMNEPSGPCQTAGSMVDTSNCFVAAYKKADADLNESYRRIMLVLDDAGKESLRAAQRAWITYRDRACDAEASPYRRGSGAGVAQLACLEAATRSRDQFMRTGFWWRVEKFAE